MKSLKILALVFIFALAAQCAVQFYPRKVTEAEKMSSNVAFAVDTLGASLLRSTQARKASKPERQKIQVQSYMFYADPKFHDPKNFYPDPGPGPIKDMKQELYKDEKDHQILLVSWPSVYKPVNPEFQKLYDTYQEDWTVYALYFKHKKPASIGVVMTHGWTGGSVKSNFQINGNRVKRLVEKGYDVLFIQQPYHGMRMPKGSYFSGEYFISGEVSRLNEAMCQAVTDMRSGVRWLKQDHKLVGMYGGSLGGVVTLTTVVNEPLLDFAIAWVPPSSWVDLTTNSQLVPYVVQAIYDSGIGFDLARQIFYPTSPANFSPAIKKEDVLIVAGMGDNFVPVNQPILIWEKWGKPQIHWFPGGHVLNFGSKQAQQVEDEFFARQEAKLGKAGK